MFKKIALATVALGLLAGTVNASPLSKFSVKDRTKVLAMIVIHGEKCDEPHTANIDKLELALKLEGGFTKKMAVSAVKEHLELIDTVGLETWCGKMDTVLETTNASMED